MLAQLASLPDTQTALLLLRIVLPSAGSPTPPGSLRPVCTATLWPPSTALFGHALTAEAWMQCTLATSAGGLGLRPAAYIASLVGTAASCLALDPAYDLAKHSAYLAAVTAHNQDALPPDHLQVPVPPNTRQRERVVRLPGPTFTFSSCRELGPGCMLLPAKLLACMSSLDSSVWSRDAPKCRAHRRSREAGQAGEGWLMSGLRNGACMGQLPSTSQSPPGAIRNGAAGVRPLWDRSN